MGIVTDRLSYAYDSGLPGVEYAIKDISLKIDDGEFIGLIGHTGSGKSTLIQHFNALLKPTSGKVYFDGEDINDPKYNRKALRGKVGLVFQYPEHQLFEENVFKDVCFGPKNMGLSDKECELKAYKALEMLKVEHEYFYQSPFDLSGGQKRRVAIAGVLATDPGVFILDEPTAGLDPAGQRDLLNLIKDLRDRTGITVILVSHSMEDVAEYVDRIIVMNKGSVFADGSVPEVFSRYRELEMIGLSAPEVTYVLNDLKDLGMSVDTTVTTIKEAKEEILKALHISAK